MPARLNRRRYREIVSTLKELIDDKKAPAARRLRAIETLLEVYRRHDVNEERKEARKHPLDAPREASELSGTTTTEQAVTTESARERARRFLEGLNKEVQTNG